MFQMSFMNCVFIFFGFVILTVVSCLFYTINKFTMFQMSFMNCVFIFFGFVILTVVSCLFYTVCISCLHSQTHKKRHPSQTTIITDTDALEDRQISNV
uniref:NADH dehydrogenase subunit 6 n=1 Tax=Panagrolaimus sp. JU765 TaxID=591449 RepID=A0AC34QYD2_9BILA